MQPVDKRLIIVDEKGTPRLPDILFELDVAAAIINTDEIILDCTPHFKLLTGLDVSFKTEFYFTDPADLSNNDSGKYRISLNGSEYKVIFKSCENGLKLIKIMPCHIVSEEIERLKFFLDNVPAVITEINRKGEILYINQARDEHYKVDQKNALFKSVFEHVDDKKRSMELLARVFNEKKPLITEDSVTIEGHTSWWLSKLMPLKGFPDRLMSVSIDITKEKEIKNRLKASEAKYQELFDKMYNGFALQEGIFDNDGNMVSYRIIEVNNAFEKILNVKNEDIINKDIFEAFPGLDKKWPKIYNECFKTNSAITANGYEPLFDKHFKIIAYPTDDKHFVVIFEDVTDEINAGKALRLQRKFLEEILDNIPVACVLINDDNTIFRINNEFEKLFGYSFDEAKGIPIENLVVPDHLWDESMSLIVNTDLEETKVLDTIRLTKSRRPLNVILTFRTIQGDHSNNIGLCTYQDITELKEKENELKLSRQRLKTFIDNVDDMIYFQSIDGQISIMNRAIKKITGYTQNDYEKDPDLWKKIMHPEDLHLAEDFFNGFAGKIDNFETTYRIITKSGTIRWINSRMFAQKDDDGIITGYYCLDRDITETKEAQDRIRQLTKELEIIVDERTRELHNANDKLRRSLSRQKDLNILKSRFITMISHEYRTPLTIILSSSHLLQRYCEEMNGSEKAKKHLHKIQSSVDSMTRMIEDVMQIGKINEADDKIKKTKFDFLKISKEMIDEFKESSDTSIELISQDNEITVQTDCSLIRQIIGNLLSNAVKFSHPGYSVKMEVENNTDTVITRVINYGDGIPKKDMKYLFDPFFRSSYHIGTVPGSGLGLTIVKQAADLLGADISVRSNPGEETLFEVTFKKD